MDIESLFVRDINRNINGVIKVGQADEEDIHQELDEYVITSELDKYFHQFFDFYVTSFRDPTDRIGVWISGFFGSGKSHFLKILSYLLRNLEVRGKHAVEFFDELKVKDATLRANIQRVAQAHGDTDVILFNIDSKARAEGKGDKEAIVQVLQKVLDDHLGYFGTNPALAHFERTLDWNGHFETFKRHYGDITGKKWEDTRKAFRLQLPALRQALMRTLGYSEEDAKSAVDGITRDYTISIQSFAEDLNTHLTRQGKNHRVIFMIDEVGQYIGGNTDLMLNLQTIAEDLGTYCQGRAWLIVTSQEKVDELTKQDAVQNRDFSRIQGRFKTRLNLSSSNGDEVIRMRLLDKKDDAVEALQALYAATATTLKNQITFSENTAHLPGYSDETSFVRSYPFVPYQFQLLQQSFTRIREMGSSGKHLSSGERSMLDAFQIAVKEVLQEEIGVLVPFHTFYKAIEGFLDHNVKQVIENASHNDRLESEDVDLLKTLFMVKYINGFRGNLENLTTLSLSSIREVKLDLRRRVEKSLQRLEKQTLIARSGDEYTFLTNEEQDVGKEIKLIDVSPGEVNEMLQEMVWTAIFDQKTIRIPGRPHYPFNRKIDHTTSGAQTADFTVHLVTPLDAQFDHLQAEVNANFFTSNGQEVLLVLPPSEDVYDEIKTYLRTAQYVRTKNTTGISSTLKKIIMDRGDENTQRKGRIEQMLRGVVAESKVYAAGKRVETSSQDPKEVIQAGAESLVENIYLKYHFIDSPFPGEAQLQNILKNPPATLNMQGKLANHLAHQDMHSWIDTEVRRNNRPTVKDVLDRFRIRPYGWSELNTLGVLLELISLDRLQLRYQGEAANLSDKNLISDLQSARKQPLYTLRPTVSVNPVHVATARELGREFFKKPDYPSDHQQLRERYHQEVTGLLEELKEHARTAREGDLPFKSEIEQVRKQFEGVLSKASNSEFFEQVHQNESVFLDASDLLAKLRGFFNERQLHLFKTTRNQLTELEPSRYYITQPDLLKRMDDARTILAMPDPTRDIPRLAGLLHPVVDYLTSLLNEHRAQALEAYDREAQHMMDLVKGISSEDAQRLTRPMLNLRQSILQAATLNEVEARKASILSVSHQVDENITNYINQQAAKTQNTKSHESCEDSKAPVPETAVPIKPIKRVQTAKLSHKTYLETAQDVEEYVERIRSILMEALETSRIRVE